MINVILCMVPVGGGASVWSVEVTLPCLPNRGDWIRVTDLELVAQGKPKVMRDFTVGAIQWELEKNEDNCVFTRIRIECEYAKSNSSCNSHLEVYESRGSRNELRETMYEGPASRSQPSQHLGIKARRNESTNELRPIR